MADIFISYKREDQEEHGRVQPIADALEAAGYDVFYDVEVPVGSSWHQTLSQKISDAKCVIVLWSQNSVDSNFVREEASIAYQANKLVPAFLDKVTPPLGFGEIEGADLSNWDGRLDHIEWRNLLAGVKNKVDAPSRAGDSSLKRVTPRRRERSGAPMGGLLVAGVALLVSAGAGWWFLAGPGKGTATVGPTETAVPISANTAPITLPASLEEANIRLCQDTPYEVDWDLIDLTQPRPTEPSQLRAKYTGIAKLEPFRQIRVGTYKGHCSATRIDEFWFVTAAHCLDDTYDGAILNFGDDDLEGVHLRTAPVEIAICHRGYTGGARPENDLALVRVPAEARRALLNVAVAEYDAPDRALVPSNYPTADIAGWGTIGGFGGVLDSRLHEYTMDLGATGPARTELLTPEGRQGPCVGDSGGPVYIRELDGRQKMIGVLAHITNDSGRRPCEAPYSSFVTSISGYRDWIGSAISFCDANPARCKPT
ncbi:MAG: TIR domain-containing protein [Pseudomonadota bacterium]